MPSLPVRLFHARALTMTLVLGWSGSSVAASTIVSARNASDPQARVFGGKLYLYASSDLNKSGSWPMNKTYCYTLSSAAADPGSAANWIDNGAVLSESDFAWTTMADHLWAPDALQGKDGQIYLYVPDVYDAASSSRVGVAVSSSPTGPFAPPSGLTNKTNFIPNGTNYMSDPNAFEDPNDPNGQRYLVYADGGYGNCGHLSIAKLDQATSAVSGNQKIQWTNQNSIPNAGSCTPAYMEGPQLSYFGGPGSDGNGKYFLYFAIKDNTSVTESIAYATADTPMGPYTYQGLIMNGQGGTGWTNQASIVEWQGHYLFFYHNDPRKLSYPNRQVFLECVGIQNGKISPVTRGSYTTLGACPKATVNPTGIGGGSSGGSTGTGAAGQVGTNIGSAPSAGGSQGTAATTLLPTQTNGGSTHRVTGSTASQLNGMGGSAAEAVTTSNAGAKASATASGNTTTSAHATGNGSALGGASGSNTNTVGDVSQVTEPASDGCSCRVAAPADSSLKERGLGLIALGLLATLRRRRQ